METPITLKRIISLVLTSSLILTIMAQPDVPNSFPADYITQFQDIHVSDDGTGFAVGKCGVLRSTNDAGQTWTTENAPTDDDMYTVSCAPDGCSRALLASNSAMYLLANGSWTDVSYDGFNDGGQLHWITPSIVVHETTGMNYYRSTDGGLTWSIVELPTWQQANMWILENGNGYIVVDSEIFRTTNQWASIESVGYTHPVAIREITWLDADNGWLYDADRLFYRTTDGGQTWVLLNADSQLTSVNWMVALSDTQLVGAQVTTFRIESLDGGVTWNRTNFLDDGNERINEKFHRSGDAFYTVGNQSQLLYSAQGFTDFTELDPFDRQNRIAPIAFESNDIGYAVSGANLLFTQDGGESWVLKPLPTVGRDLAVLDDGSVVILTGGTSYISGDRGDNFGEWLSEDVAPSGEGPIVQTRKPNGEMYLLSSNYGYLSTDGGQSFTPYNTGHKFSPEDVFFIDQNNGFAVGRQSQFMSTSDGGQTWNVGAGPGNNLVDVFFLDTENGWVSTASSRWSTTDGGLTWDSKGSTGGYDMVRHPGDGAILSARFGSGNTGNLMRSTDNGETWTIIAKSCFSYRAAALSPDGRYFYTAGDGFIVRHELDNIISSSRDLHGSQVRQISVYPNPTAGEINIALPESNSGATIALIASNGQVLRRKTIAAGESIIFWSLHDVPPGIYMVRWTGKQEVGIARVVKY